MAKDCTGTEKARVVEIAEEKDQESEQGFVEDLQIKAGFTSQRSAKKLYSIVLNFTKYFLQNTAGEEEIFLKKERNRTTIHYGSINDQRHRTND